MVYFFVNIVLVNRYSSLSEIMFCGMGVCIVISKGCVEIANYGTSAKLSLGK